MNKQIKTTHTVTVKGKAGSEGAAGQPGEQGIYGGFSTHWVFGKGGLSADALPFKDVKAISLPYTNADKKSVEGFLRSFMGGSLIRIFDKADSAAFVHCQIQTLKHRANRTDLTVYVLAASGGFEADNAYVVSYSQTGQRGAAGSIGVDGADGAQGIQGVAGAVGAPGAPGATGQQGMHGGYGSTWEYASNISGGKFIATFGLPGTEFSEVTDITISNGDINNSSFLIWSTNLTEGDTLTIQKTNDASKLGVYTISGISGVSPWKTFTVGVEASNGSLVAAETYVITGSKKGNTGPSGLTLPGSSTDNAIVRWDGATGDALQDSAVQIDDTGAIGVGITPNVSTGISVGDYTTSLSLSASTSISSQKKLNIGGEWSGGGGQTGINVAPLVAPASDISQFNAFTLAAIMFNGSGGAKNIGSWKGNWILPLFNGYTGTITDMHGLLFQPLFLSAATVTNMYGIQIKPQVLVGTVVNAWGIKVDNMPVGTTSTYAIQTGTGQCEFGDDVTILGTMQAKGIKRQIDTATISPTTVGTTDHIILADATSGTITVNLPAASDTGRELVIKKIDSSANAVTIVGDGAETIDGATTVVLSAQYAKTTIVSDGVAWNII